MKKIEKLTQEQINKFPEYIGKWTDIGLSTKPANRLEAEEGIREAYKIVGLSSPAIVWCGSPLSNGLVRAIIEKLKEKDIKEILGDSVGASVWDSVWDSVRASVGDSVWDSVGASVWASVRDSVGASVWDSVGASVRDSVRDSVWDSVGDSVRDSVGASVWDSVGASVRASVWDPVGDSVRDSVRASVGYSVGDSVWDSVGDSVGDSVRDSVGASVRDSVRASVWDSVGDSVRDSGYGQHDANWLGFYDYFFNECNLISETEKLNGLWKISKNAGWYLPHEKICFVSERHNKLNRDERGRLHSETEAALTYPDGWSIHAIHGVRVPEWIVLRPEEITVDKIESEQNQEIKRIMIDRFGMGKYMEQSGCEELHRDDFGILLSKKRNNMPDMRMVKVINGSYEGLWHKNSSGEMEFTPDHKNGELYRKEYFLRVPPETKTAVEGVAWTYNMTPDEYVKIAIRT